MAQLELRISGTQMVSYLPSLVLHECGHKGGCPYRKRLHSQSPVSTFHHLRAVGMALVARGKVDLKLKMVFRELSKRKRRKDGMQ